MKRKIALLSLAAVCVALAGCDEIRPSAASRETQATLKLTEAASIAVGMPAISNFTEKRQLKAIYELRDQANLVTYTYSLDMNGKRHKVCPSTSVGFGMPYSTQYTAPNAMQRWFLPSTPDYSAVWGTRDAAQPEPNGLHMPASAEGTWVMCLHPVTHTLAPTYVEPRVIVYLFEMPSVD